MEKELLSIVYTLQEYRSMLYGCKALHIHTDHKNLTYASFNSQQVFRWRLFLEEFAPICNYIEGERNKLADALSHLRFTEGKSAGDAVSPHSHPQNNSMLSSGTPGVFTILDERVS
jgi:RNase H-like domain found in reverse transcriptase